MSEAQDAVLVNPGSSVTTPVSERSFETVIPSFPSVAATRGSSSSFPLSARRAGVVVPSDIIMLPLDIQESVQKFVNPTSWLGDVGLSKDVTARSEEHTSELQSRG